MDTPYLNGIADATQDGSQFLEMNVGSPFEFPGPLMRFHPCRPFRAADPRPGTLTHASPSFPKSLPSANQALNANVPSALMKLRMQSSFFTGARPAFAQYGPIAAYHCCDTTLPVLSIRFILFAIDVMHANPSLKSDADFNVLANSSSRSIFPFLPM